MGDTGVPTGPLLPIAHSVQGAVDGVLGRAKATGALTDDDLTVLWTVFRQTFHHALDLVDRGKVNRLTAQPSARVLYQVVGSQGKLYTLLANENFCECPSYTYGVVRGEQLMCKHTLAARVADALSKCRDRTISDKDFVAMLCPSELTTAQLA
eukprot:m.186587 g.186587  ORF g.186587 m.186587 type:complete len:153 (-) comp18141_c0_seq4:88-546(-)